MIRESLAILMVLVLGLAGCSSKDAPIKTFVLHAPQDITPVSVSRFKQKSIQVTHPESLKEKMNQDMHFSYSASEQGSYSQSQWSNDTGKLLQGITIQTLVKSGLFKGVVSYASTAQADYRLESTVFDFSHRVREQASDAIVSIQYNLISADSGRLLKSKRFNYIIPTKTTNAEGYAEATNEAIRRLSRDLVLWLR
jgi:cholesterol transport system auxiliary component